MSNITGDQGNLSQGHGKISVYIHLAKFKNLIKLNVRDNTHPQEIV